MKFELSPDNRNATNEALLDDLRAVARGLSSDSVSRDQYDSAGRFHPKTLVKRFGTWNRALTLAGLRVRKPHKISAEEFVADLKEVAASLQKPTLTVAEYTKLGTFSTKPLAQLFGTWANALRAAGLEPDPSYRSPLSEEELYQNLEAVWRTIGRQPKRSDLRGPLSRASADAYVRRFGSWRKALEKFVAFTNETPVTIFAESEPRVEVDQTREHRSPPRTNNRGVSWRLRFLVMRRDNFRCCQCGSSPALSPGTVLVVDHVYPWSKGGETVIENLQTLCAPCNGGKSHTVVGVTPHAA